MHVLISLVRILCLHRRIGKTDKNVAVTAESFSLLIGVCLWIRATGWTARETGTGLPETRVGMMAEHKKRSHGQSCCSAREGWCCCVLVMRSMLRFYQLTLRFQFKSLTWLYLNQDHWSFICMSLSWFQNWYNIFFCLPDDNLIWFSSQCWLFQTNQQALQYSTLGFLWLFFFILRVIPFSHLQQCTLVQWSVSL